MGHSYNAGFACDYSLLRAATNCDLAELKRCYRLAVRDLHPDRNPDLANDVAAQEALRELTASYRRLLDYHRLYGRLPGELPHRSSLPPQTTSVSADKVPRRRLRWAAWAAIALLIAYVNWPHQTTSPLVPAERIPASRVIEAPTAHTDSMATTPSAAARKAIRIGDSRLRVRSILGSPMISSPTVWEYGPSHVLFKEGRVVDWYNSPLKPLPVDEKSRDPGWVNPDIKG